MGEEFLEGCSEMKRRETRAWWGGGIRLGDCLLNEVGVLSQSHTWLESIL